MTAALVVTAAVVLVFALSAGLALWFEDRRTPAELRGDWWSAFEQEFRAYSTRSAQPRGETRRNPPTRRPDRRDLR